MHTEGWRYKWGFLRMDKDVVFRVVLSCQIIFCNISDVSCGTINYPQGINNLWINWCLSTGFA